jgi:hypothetical protein
MVKNILILFAVSAGFFEKMYFLILYYYYYYFIAKFLLRRVELTSCRAFIAMESAQEIQILVVQYLYWYSGWSGNISSKIVWTTRTVSNVATI